jgi:Holliday junction resolvase RusA-like endonuclease
MKFTIPGEPTGKGRPRVTKRGTYTPEKTKNYETLVKLCYKGPCHDGPLEMKVKAFYKIPKSASKKKKELMESDQLLPTKTPDCDNVLKIIADGLNGTAYDDDKQIVKATIEKYYSYNPRVEVEIGGLHE